MVSTTLSQVGIGVIREPATDDVAGEVATWVKRDVFTVDNSCETGVFVEIHRCIDASVLQAMLKARSKVLHVGNSDCLVAN